MFLKKCPADGWILEKLKLCRGQNCPVVRNVQIGLVHGPAHRLHGPLVRPGVLQFGPASSRARVGSCRCAAVEDWWPRRSRRPGLALASTPPPTLPPPLGPADALAVAAMWILRVFIRACIVDVCMHAWIYACLLIICRDDFMQPQIWALVIKGFTYINYTLVLVCKKKKKKNKFDIRPFCCHSKF